MLRMKYLLTLGLAMLVVSTAGGAAFAGAGWRVDGVDFPDYVGWEKDFTGTIDIHNDGAVDLTDPAYALWSCEGTSVAVTLLTERWGPDEWPMPEDGIDVGATESVELELVAPPITTISATPTLACDWALRDVVGAAYVGGPSCAEADIAIGRYPDSLEWHLAETENDAGRVPFIVQGFPDGLYRPNMKVPRDQMAVFIRRGMVISPTSPAEATFTDVDDEFWAYADIETLADAGVVEGFADGSYQPGMDVTRAQMAVFVARAKGWVAIDDDMTMEDDVFDDVPGSYWCALAVDECVNGGVVQGFGDGTYRPTMWVDRAQMSVYTWRAFQGASYPVVLGGPAFTDLNLPAVTYHGWTETSPTVTSSSYCYVEFSNDSLSSAMAGAGTWDITFEFYSLAIPTNPTLSTSTTANVAGGSLPGTGQYFTVYKSVPALTTAGDYRMKVKVEDADDVFRYLPREVDFYSDGT